MTDRRMFLLGATALGLGAATGAFAQGALPPKSPMGVATTAMSMHMRGIADPPGLRDDPIRYMEFLRSLGAGGLQMGVPAEHVPAFRRRLEELEMYYEGQARLPGKLTDDLSGFEESVKISAALGATVMRAVSRQPERPNAGRRYETFTSHDDYKAWEAEANAIVEKCLPIAERYKVAIALENHKDRTAEEHLAFLKRFDSEYLGALIDPGNNMSLLEDPVETVTMLAPYAKACSLKDMAVAPYEQGFLLSEVQFGTGITDQAALFGIMRKHNPKIHPTTELITRDPLKVPILTEAYFASIPQHRGRRDAWMEMVRAKATELPHVSHLTPAQRLQAEEDNNRQVMEWGIRHIT